MPTESALSSMQQAIRGNICIVCYRRPQGSETLGPDVPRSCEGECTIFLNLGTLKEIADASSPGPGNWQRAMRELICRTCEQTPQPGDDCPANAARTCPLSRYAARVVQVLEHVQP